MLEKNLTDIVKDYEHNMKALKDDVIAVRKNDAKSTTTSPYYNHGHHPNAVMTDTFTDRLSSLSDQIAILESRLGVCKCQKLFKHLIVHPMKAEWPNRYEYISVHILLLFIHI